jgi:F1F0 ATPase subunit 2
MNEIINQITAIDMLSLLSALLGGVLLGTFFFAGLWWTVHRGSYATYPAVWFFSSFLLRTVITIFGIYLLTDGQLAKLSACLLGFIGARIVIIRIIQPVTNTEQKQESNDAP